MGRKAPWDSWYDTAAWQKRREHQLALHPLCSMCLHNHGLVVPATIVDHVEPHHGSWNSFRLGKLQSLCKQCHDSTKREIEQRGYSTEIGIDGFPIDVNHPFYR
jgi:hypothetical protein